MQDSAHVMAELATPLGEPGSGRQRYGAAMALHHAGRIPAEVLEVYRICSARDRDDPLALIRARGLPVPEAAIPSTETPIAALVGEIETYLRSLDGPGVAEVRTGMARWRNGPVTCPPAPGRLAMQDHLATALDTLRARHPALARAIADAAPVLDWHAFTDYPPAEIGADFLSGNAFCSVIGETGPVRSVDFDLGLFLLPPHLLYRDRCHRAPELYAPLTGPHGWRFSPGDPLVLKDAHDPVWNAPFVPHLTKVGPHPFLCIYAWTADVNCPVRVLPAGDWTALEALRLEASAPGGAVGRRIPPGPARR